MRIKDTRNSDRNAVLVASASAELGKVHPNSIEAQLLRCKMSFAPHIAKSLALSIERTNHLSVMSASSTAIELGLGTKVFRVTLNDAGMWNCTDGCGKGMYKGRPCVHLLKTFHLQGMDFFQSGYIHNHWKVQTNYDFENIQAAFKSNTPMDYLCHGWADPARGLSDIEDTQNGILHENEDTNLEDVCDMTGTTNPNATHYPNISPNIIPNITLSQHIPTSKDQMAIKILPQF
jgi:hypothetical protein